MAKTYPPKPTKAALNTWKKLSTTKKGAASVKRQRAESDKYLLNPPGGFPATTKPKKVKPKKPTNDRIAGGAQPFHSGIPRKGAKPRPPYAGPRV